MAIDWQAQYRELLSETARAWQESMRVRAMRGDARELVLHYREGREPREWASLGWFEAGEPVSEGWKLAEHADARGLATMGAHLTLEQVRARLERCCGMLPVLPDVLTALDI